MLRIACVVFVFFFFSSRRRHTRFDCDWSSDVCSSDLRLPAQGQPGGADDPRPRRAAGHGGAHVLEAARRQRCEEGAAGGDRECREQPFARRRPPGGGRGVRGPQPEAEALSCPRPRPWRPRGKDLEQHHRGRARARRSGGEGVMGQKVNPIGLRVGINRTWDSRWYANRNFAELLHQDLKLKKYLTERLGQAGVSRIVIERPAKKARVTIHTARPGVVIGKKGADIEKLRSELAKMTGSEVSLNIVEIRKPEIDAKLIADNIAQQLERRVAFRRAMKRAVQSAMRLGALGIRINCAGRLGGAEIARMEWYREGRVPLHTLRAEIDFGDATAKTTYGTCGVKVWVFKGEIMAHDPMASDKRASEAQPTR